MADPVNVSIVEHFQSLEDPRIERSRKHRLIDILVIALCTLLSGGEGFQDMELFGKSKCAWLQTFLALPHGIPSHDTFGRVSASIPDVFRSAFWPGRRPSHSSPRGHSSRSMAKLSGLPLTALPRLPPCICSRRGVPSRGASS